MKTLVHIEAERLREQEALDLLKDAAERNQWGQFATPPALALDIAEHACKRWRKDGPPVRFLDPALGTGAFYAALRQAFHGCAQIETETGIELDPQFAEAATRLWNKTGLTVRTADFTTATPAAGERYNLILTNPPYVRHHHLSQADKQRLRHAVLDELGIQISGLAGLYAYFLLLSHKWLAEGGLSIWLIPSEFMDVNYGTAMKQYLTEKVRLLHVHRFSPSDVQFADALVSSAVVLFQNTPPKPSSDVLFTFGGSLRKPNLTEHVPLTNLNASRKWTSYPRATFPSIPTTPTRLTLSDLFEVKRGLATGANDFFVVPRTDLQRLGVPADSVKPILPSPRYLRQPVIEADKDGYPLLDEQLALIDCRHDQNELREAYPLFWTYLEGGIERGLHNGYLTSRRVPWYSQEHRAPAPFLCTYMGRLKNGRTPFRFFWNKSNAIAANVFLMLYPKPLLRDTLRKNPALCSAVFEFLQSITVEMLLGEGRVYGGGLYKLEPKELGRVPADSIAHRLTSLHHQHQMTILGM